MPAPPTEPLLTLITLMPSGISQTAPIVPNVATTPALVNTENTTPVVTTKRLRDPQDDDAENEQPVKRLQLPIGGERCPQFVFYNDYTFNPAQFLPHSRDQRLAIQEQLGGNWRFAKTFQQEPCSHRLYATKWGVSRFSSFLFVKVDDKDIIVDVICQPFVILMRN